jgi:hypothetical protein
MIDEVVDQRTSTPLPVGLRRIIRSVDGTRTRNSRFRMYSESAVNYLFRMHASGTKFKRESPYGIMAMRFKRLSDCIVFSFKVCCSVVALRIELSAIRLSDAGFFSWLTRGLQPSTTISSVGCVGIEPLSIAPNDLCQPLHFTPDSCYVSGQAGNRTLLP